MNDILFAPASAADRVCLVLAAAGFPVARIGIALEAGARPITVAGYRVEHGRAGRGPRVTWDQRLSADAMEAKLEQLADALEAAGLRVAWEDRAPALEVLP